MRIGDKGPAQDIAPMRSEKFNSAANPGAKVETDATTVLGIPEGELTPKVREAIMALMSEMSGLRQDVDGLRRRLQEAETEADIDPLVPALNRRAFVRELSRTISFSERYNSPASLVYFDVNNFKEINDVFGHGVGDLALLHIAESLSENIRESDILGRLGGDEFGVILVQADDNSAAAKAEQLRNAIESNPISQNGQEIRLSVTPGVSTFRAGDDAAAALARADQEMYDRKRSEVAGHVSARQGS